MNNKKVNTGPQQKGPGASMAGGEKPKNLKLVFSKLFKFMKKRRILVYIACFIAALSSVLTLFGPNQLSNITDIIQEHVMSLQTPNVIDLDLDALINIGIFLGIIYLISFLFSVSQGLLMTSVIQKTSKNLRTSLTKKINKLPMGYFSKVSKGDVLSRVTNDIDILNTSLTQSLGTFIRAITLFFGSLIMMYITEPFLATTAVLSSAIGFIFMMVVIKSSQKHFKGQQKYLGTINGQIEEMYSGHTVIKAYNAEKESVKDFNETNRNLKNSAFKAQSFSGLMMPMMTFIGNLGYVAVCIVGSILTINGTIDFGTVIAFIIYIRLFTQPLGQIAQAMQSLQSGAAAAERVFDFLELDEMSDESSKIETLGEVKGKVEFKNVNFSYNPDRTIINNFSAEALPGQKVAIVGPTGAGKTTMVNLLMRFYEINSGDILIDDKSIYNVTREDVHDKFCMVLQDTWIFEGTVRENLVYSANGITDEKLDEVCVAVGLHHFIKTLPNGYDTILNDALNLSQGQKQQITIARAMIADKPMLILDEATSSVDTRTELVIQQAMDNLMKNRTSFVIAHRLSTIKNADLILVMKDGDIIESGNHLGLLEQKGFYAELYNSQFEQVEE